MSSNIGRPCTAGHVCTLVMMADLVWIWNFERQHRALMSCKSLHNLIWLLSCVLSIFAAVESSSNGKAVQQHS